jgi:hypothetical protein
MQHKILQVFALGSSWLCREAYCMRFIVVWLLCSFLTEGIRFTVRIQESKHLSCATKFSSQTKMVCTLSYLLWSVCFARGLRVILVMNFLFCKRVENHPGYEVSVLQEGRESSWLWSFCFAKVWVDSSFLGTPSPGRVCSVWSILVLLHKPQHAAHHFCSSWALTSCHSCTRLKVCGPYAVILLNPTPILE